MAGWRASAWAETIRGGLRTKGIALEDAAHRIGVPVSTFRAWLDGLHLPSVAVFDRWAALAELVGVSESELLRAAGVLPDTFVSSLFLAQATRELRDGLDRANQLLRQASALGQSSAVGQVVNELSTSGTEWEIRLRSARRGAEIRIVNHHYVGIVPPPELDSWTGKQLRAFIQRDVLAHIWQPLGLYWRVAEPHDWLGAPELLIQVPEQEGTRPPSGLAPSPDTGPVAVLSPPWGYGELLGSLVADGLGFGNIDFRYFGVPDDHPHRLAIVQAEIDNGVPGFVMSVTPLMQLEGLDIGSGQLVGTLPILISYGQRFRAKAAEIFRSRLARFGDEAGIATVEERNRRAVDGLPAGSRYIEVTIADEDVMVEGRVDRHRLSDTIAWLALAVTCMLLESWGAPPVPVGGPLRSMVLPSGRVRPAPATASHAAWRNVGDTRSAL